MLLKRKALINLRFKIQAIDHGKIPDHLPAKKIIKQKPKQELYDDLVFYIKYCLENTANPDEEYEAMLKRMLEKAKKQEDLREFL